MNTTQPANLQRLSRRAEQIDRQAVHDALGLGRRSRAIDIHTTLFELAATMYTRLSTHTEIDTVSSRHHLTIGEVYPLRNAIALPNPNHVRPYTTIHALGTTVMRPVRDGALKFGSVDTWGAFVSLTTEDRGSMHVHAEYAAPTGIHCTVSMDADTRLRRLQGTLEGDVLYASADRILHAHELVGRVSTGAMTGLDAMRDLASY